MDLMATVTFLDGSKKKYKKGTSFLEISKEIENPNELPFVGLKVNKRMCELFEILTEDCTVEFFDISDPSGNRYYVRGLKILLFRALRDLYGECKLYIKHAVNKGIYCEVENLKITKSELEKIEKKMRQIVEKNELIEKITMKKEDAMKIFQMSGLTKKVKLFRYKTTSTVNVYKLGWVYDYFFGFMVPSTGFLTKFSLTKAEKGFILKFPTSYMPHTLPDDVNQEKLFDTFNESKEWADVLGISTVGDLNELISKGKANEIIYVAEALQEKKIGIIADDIVSTGKIGMVLIAGPSSSGKTTFANRLAIQLRANCKQPFIISLDNYYLEKDHPSYPRDEFGNLDFEALEALDIELFNQNMKDLMAGKEVTLPTFDFNIGKRIFEKKPTQLAFNSIIIIEGIHGLNEKLSKKIARDKKYKIYVSALTPLNLDEHNRISTSDNRLLRRIVRDNQFRSYSAERTLAVWESVRRGEEKNIFPYQEEADVVFNTALVYELPILKHFVEPLLYGVDEHSVYFAEAKRLIKFMSYILGIDTYQVPKNSLIREFIGGSFFY